MSVPTNRDEFKAYCLRELGAPVIEINVADEQVDDRIDEAVRYWWDYHFDGSEMLYYKHQVTANNMSDQYIIMPENILGVVEVFPIGDPSIRSDDLFNIRYQIALNDLYSLTSTSLVPYYMAMEHLALISEMLVGRQPIRFNRHRNQLHIDMDWSKLNIGEYLLIRAYQVVDPTEFQDAWGDRWLLRYAAQLIKRQWGTNMKKFKGLKLPGGVEYSGQEIYDEADREIKRMEDEMIKSFSLPVMDMVG